jgi:phage FluMu gp28-like protein
VRSTLTATGGPVRIIGNIKGRRNWFYDMARRAEGNDPDMHYAKLIAADAVEAGIVKADEVEAAKRDLPEAVFNELYLAIPNDDGGNPFGLKAILERIKPLSTLPPVAFGVDLAKSVDWCVIIGLDVNGDVCRFERFQKIPWDEIEDRIIKAIGSGIPCLVDSTGVGDPVVERMQKKNPMITGFKFTSKSKQQLMEGLAVAIQSGTVGYPEGIIPMELSAFEYLYGRTGVTYSAPEGQHDDTVCSLALARSILTSTEGSRGFNDYYAQQALHADARAAGINPDDPVALQAWLETRKT